MATQEELNAQRCTILVKVTPKFSFTNKSCVFTVKDILVLLLSCGIPYVSPVCIFHCAPSQFLIEMSSTKSIASLLDYLKNVQELKHLAVHLEVRYLITHKDLRSYKLACAEASNEDLWYSSFGYLKGATETCDKDTSQNLDITRNLHGEIGNSTQTTEAIWIQDVSTFGGGESVRKPTVQPAETTWIPGFTDVSTLSSVVRETTAATGRTIQAIMQEKENLSDDQLEHLIEELVAERTRRKPEWDQHQISEKKSELDCDTASVRSFRFSIHQEPTREEKLYAGNKGKKEDDEEEDDDDHDDEEEDDHKDKDIHGRPLEQILKAIRTKPPKLQRFSGTDPIPKHEIGYTQWSLTLKSYIDVGIPEDLLIESVRNSLRGQAADLMMCLGPKASVKNIIEELEVLFGNNSSYSMLEKVFCSIVQEKDESVTSYCVRLSRAFNNLLLSDPARALTEKGGSDERLRGHFFEGLHPHLRTGLDYLMHQPDITFQELKRHVRRKEDSCKIRFMRTKTVGHNHVPNSSSSTAGKGSTKPSGQNGKEKSFEDSSEEDDY